MAKSLSAFLAQNAKKVDNRKIALSPRFVDENGKAMEWEITCITAAENQKLRKDSLRNIPVPGKRGQYTQEMMWMERQVPSNDRSPWRTAMSCLTTPPM